MSNQKPMNMDGFLPPVQDIALLMIGYGMENQNLIRLNPNK